ncbi:MAG: hypothetical protein QM791_21455 [Ferruginibacter sp.]
MKKYKIILSALVGGTLLFQSCKKFDKMLNDPSLPTPETANVDTVFKFYTIIIYQFLRRYRC